MLRIQRIPGSDVVFSLSGRIEPDDLEELQRLLGLEAAGQGIALDLKEITLVDREAVKFLARCENEGVKLGNCPAYIREWIEMERGGSKRHESAD
jgi:hypothetical protein